MMMGKLQDRSLNMQALLSPKIKEAVAACLAARVIAEVKREQVDKIQRAILGEIELLATLHSDGHRITNPDHVYLCEDDAACKRYYAECSKHERDAGIKPADMQEDFCPALVAEHAQVNAENALLDLSGEAVGVDTDHLYGEKRQKWLDLVIGAIFAAEREGLI